MEKPTNQPFLYLHGLKHPSEGQDQDGRGEDVTLTFSHKHIKKNNNNNNKTHPHVERSAQNIYLMLAKDLKTSKKEKKFSTQLGRRKGKKKKERKDEKRYRTGPAVLRGS